MPWNSLSRIEKANIIIMKPRRVGLAREIFNTGNADAYCFAVVTHDIGEREKMLPSQIPILNKNSDRKPMCF